MNSKRTNWAADVARTRKFIDVEANTSPMKGKAKLLTLIKTGLMKEDDEEFKMIGLKDAAMVARKILQHCKAGGSAQPVSSEEYISKLMEEVID